MPWSLSLLYLLINAVIDYSSSPTPVDVGRQPPVTPPSKVHLASTATQLSPGLSIQQSVNNVVSRQYSGGRTGWRWDICDVILRIAGVLRAHMLPQGARLPERLGAVRARVVAALLVHRAHMRPQLARLPERLVAVRARVVAPLLVHRAHMRP